MTDSTAPSTLRTRITWIVLVAAVLGSMLHQAGPVFRWEDGVLTEIKWRLWEWYIEDAAISFAYARNWAAGDGLVAFPGGERIEGYSNPTWVALMALWYLVGVDGFWSSKIMAMIFGGLTVLLAWRITDEIVDDRESWAPLVAAVVLAAFPTFAFWNASGLENPLFNFLLAGGIWRTVVEGKKGGFPWAAVWFLFLACTRPEGIMYGAWGGFIALMLALLHGRGLKPVVLWLLAFFVPFVTYHVIRYEYFAHLFPNTYYAKLGHRDFRPFAWMGRGWKQIRGWAADSGFGWFTPVVLSGLIGLRGPRRWLVPVASVVAFVLMVYPDSEITQGWSWWPNDLWAPRDWAELRVWGFVAFVALLPIATLRDPRSAGRILCWGMALITMFFSVRANGDWMKGYRWLSMLVVPASVLFAVGVEEIATLLQRALGRRRLPGWGWPAHITAIALTIAVMPGFFMHSDFFFAKRETGPFSVRKRVEFTDWVMRRVYVHDRLIRNLDVDMGAHLYWSPHQMVDMAGLVDVSIAHHNYAQRAFTQEYVFKEMKPLVAHVHGGWASTSKIPTFAEWKRDYIEIPGFPVSDRTNHMGNHLRRDLLMVESWDGPAGREVQFDGSIVLKGFRVPSPEVSQGKYVYVEVGVEYRAIDDKQDFQLFAFLSDDAGHGQAFEVPLGYGWLPPSSWRLGETFSGRFTFPTNPDLPPGLYDLGFFVLDGEGKVVPLAQTDTEPPRPVMLPERAVAPGVGDAVGRFAKHEVRFPSVVRIGPPGTSEAAADEDLARAMAAAEGGDCAQAEADWRLARVHLPNASNWHEARGVAFGEAIASCYARGALAAEDPFDAVPMLTSGRVWDFRNDDLVAAMRQIGATLFALGDKAAAEGDWTAAYEAYAGALEANPSLSWARRNAEDARDHRLGLVKEEDEGDTGLRAWISSLLDG